MKETFNKDLEEIKKSQSIMNNAITEIKNTLEGTNRRITEAEDRINEVEDRMVEINEAERKKEKRIKRNEDNLRDLWDNVKRPNIRIIGVPEEEDKKKDHEKILEEITVETFPILGKFSTIISSSIFPWSFFLSSSSGTPMIRILGHLTLSWRSLRLSSFLLICFSFFLSDSFISTILSSISLILSSASVILLFVVSRVFLISFYCIIHYILTLFHYF